jgi:hypothetical protein
VRVSCRRIHTNLGLNIEQIEGEGQLRPKAGEARSIGGGELKWREVALTNEVIDFNELLGQQTSQQPPAKPVA